MGSTEIVGQAYCMTSWKGPLGPLSEAPACQERWNTLRRPVSMDQLVGQLRDLIWGQQKLLVRHIVWQVDRGHWDPSVRLKLAKKGDLGQSISWLVAPACQERWNTLRRPGSMDQLVGQLRDLIWGQQKLLVRYIVLPVDRGHWNCSVRLQLSKRN